MSKYNILILAPFDFIKIPTQILNNGDFNLHLKYKKEKTINLKLSSDIDGLITDPGANYKIDSKFLSKFKNLKVIVTPSTGVNHIDNDYCKANKIFVYCLLDDRRSLNKITASAEFTFASLLMGLRKIKKVIHSDLYNWRTREELYRGFELSGKKIGIIGYGRIGRKINEFAIPFKASCIFYDPYVNKYNIKKIKKTNSIKLIFKTCDVIVICPYLTSTSNKLINFSLLKVIKKNALIVNTSRGEIINENDLIKLIKLRKDIFINLDVIQNEQQILKNNRLIELSKKDNNLFITPHIAGLTYESQIKAGLFALKKITNFFM
ncbi:NAD(P)-dependent oxidoreductase [Alphaproteobacteria bacterium]|jgi:D-3-phosphoglycerate dehydrogenase / 2-oxoglutarate reductase|nr:NAD(P)-dependent oxidoreductase [Alphaproteobacteria bacterium]